MDHERTLFTHLRCCETIYGDHIEKNGFIVNATLFLFFLCCGRGFKNGGIKSNKCAAQITFSFQYLFKLLFVEKRNRKATGGEFRNGVKVFADAITNDFVSRMNTWAAFFDTITSFMLLTLSSCSFEIFRFHDCLLRDDYPDVIENDIVVKIWENISKPDETIEHFYSFTLYSKVDLRNISDKVFRGKRMEIDDANAERNYYVKKSTGFEPLQVLLPVRIDARSGRGSYEEASKNPYYPGA
ncbi:hypothetical protein BDA99DRAFT_568178 [Phascolomyces articulosus]|uniref:Uncharacterized protein n=1 Tax=Phascolomyces articulosus TaxID=60185 RepID=A0AAD5KM99_9FUNG|nr:hypothetical protein BDA99DRAFT_568178 [Phascolomyces articulosus]